MTERKRLKAIRRRNKMVKSFNFETKTLSKAKSPLSTDSVSVKNLKVRKLYHNKAMRREREGVIK